MEEVKGIPTIAEKTQMAILFLISFTIPLYKPLISPLIALFILSSIFNLKKELTWNKAYLYLLPYFLWLATGLIWTDNLSKGLFELEVSLSLFMLPITFMISNLNWTKLFANISKYYILGLCSSIVISLCFGGYQYLTTSDISWLFYSKLSVFHHPSYFAMYCSFGLIIVYHNLIFKDSIFTFLKRSSILFLLITFISLFTFILLSKTGILILAIINLVGLFVYVNQQFKLRLALISSLILASILVGSYFVITPLKTRVDEAISSLTSDETKESSTGARILIWESVSEIIYEQPILGTGTGDLKDELVKKYKSKGFEKILHKSLNSHNQFLETLGKSGIIGLISLVLLFIPVVKATKLSIRLYTFFVIIILINFLTESMLETQSGVVFFAFFNSLFVTITISLSGMNANKNHTFAP